MIYGLILLVAASVTIASALPPCVCTRNYQPVCGSDGQTYANPCMLECAKTTNHDLSMVKTGNCRDEAQKAVCVCTYEYKPVCGSDGNTYPNKCALNCQRSVKLIVDGPCPEQQSLKREIPPCVCTREARPVCGSDGVTYSNPCQLNCATATNPKLSLKAYGPCVDEVKVAELLDISCACTRNMQPVCGSDSKTYNNPCLLNCATKNNPSLSIARKGPCEGVNVVDNAPRPVSGCACTRELAPVCASDGETYSSACIMRCRNPNAELVRDGPCEV